ncbi:hypothetical protein O1D40_001731 [Vibrio cholerae]|uniref:hypothetical protein n=1 Tax=Vibrio cidicii TaxID=1763883 RepID=UPI0018C27DE0|nr:hypothetical protein [Vibrio cidicii]EGR1451197.1 hypothetical protein [Vibrio cholerae]EKF9630008.1 hypothetical protein [Vibrio cholerae]EKF9819732.1 hypothetical protein [Vibrio cholerae]MBG0761713.1 hypothetical protein [Vibrio cidicii]
MQKVEICDLEEIISQIVEKNTSIDFNSIDFSGLYPDIGIKLIGDESRLNGTLNSTICKGLSDFHNDFLKAYCIIKYNSDNLKQLKQGERQKLEFIYTVNPGCTDILVAAKDFCDSLKQAVDSVTKDMTGTQKTALFLVAVLSVGGYFAFDSYNERLKAEIAAQKETAIVQTTAEKEVSLAEIERDRMDKLVDALEKSIESSNAANERALKFKAQVDKAYEGMVKQSLAAGATKIQYRGATKVTLGEDEARDMISKNKKQLVTETGVRGVEVASVRWTDDGNLSITARTENRDSVFLLSVDTTYVDQSEVDVLINDGFGKKEIIYVNGSFKVRGGIVERAIASGISKEKPLESEGAR